MEVLVWTPALADCSNILCALNLVAHASIIMGFVLLQSTIKPFKSTLIGLLDTFFMVNFLLIVVFNLIASQEVLFWAYMVLTILALLVIFCTILFHAVMPRNIQRHLDVVMVGMNSLGGVMTLILISSLKPVDTY